MSAPANTARFLSQNWISELVWDTESEEAGVPSNSFSEDEGGFEDKPGVSHLQLDRPTSSGQASSSLLSSSASDEEEIFQGGPGQHVQTPSLSQWTWPSGPQRNVVHTFTGGSREKRDSKAPHINEGSSPLSIFFVVFCRNYYTAAGGD